MRQCDLQGPHGKAWRRTLGPKTLVAGWYIDYRGAIIDHWGWYALHAVRLDEDSAMQYPTAEHELQMLPVALPVDVDSSKWVLAGTPVLAAQIDGVGEQGVQALLDAAVIAIVRGGMAPSSSSQLSNLWLEVEQRLRNRRRRRIVEMEQQVLDEVKAKSDAK